MKYRKKTLKVVKTKNERIICAVYGSKKPRFIKEQEASELLCSLRIRRPSS